MSPKTGGYTCSACCLGARTVLHTCRARDSSEPTCCVPVAAIPGARVLRTLRSR